MAAFARLLCKQRFWHSMIPFLFIWLGLAAWNNKVSGHFLTQNKISLDAVDREIGFDQYLAAICIPTIAGLIAILWQSKEDQGEWRYCAVAAINCLCLAVALVTCGYGLRVWWFQSGYTLHTRLIAIDLYFLGPLTAIAFIAAIACLVRMAFAGIPRVLPPRL
jgi:hypothetical protein